MATPGWQTEELGEEWVESTSPPHPPPATLNNKAVNALSGNDADSVRAKRGSLRMLGQASTRGLPLARDPSGSSRSQSGHGRGSIILSGEFMVPAGDGLESDPAMGLEIGSEGDQQRATGTENRAPGTFFIREGVEDDRGKALLRSNAKSKDIFGKNALERMFEPPSPPQAVPPLGDSRRVSANGPPTESAPRRASHAYAPARPSRLSKSTTPSTASTSINGSDGPDDTGVFAVTDGGDASGPAQLLEPADDQDEEAMETQQPADDRQASPPPSQLSPFASPDHPFDFVAPVRSTSGTGSGTTQSGSTTVRGGTMRTNIFAPSLDPLPNGAPTHSTLQRSQRSMGHEHVRRSPIRAKIPSHKVSTSPGRPGLQLFRRTYDTYTREHLSAIVDSIAIEASPSPPNTYRHRQDEKDEHRWSPAASPEASGSSPDKYARDGWSGSGSGSGSGMDAPSGSDESRSSKRLRLSPPSPQRGPRDWGAQGRALMDRIKLRAEESTTSASPSKASTAGSLGADGRASFDFAESPPQVVYPSRPSQVDRPTHRSNPSTTSSGYLRAAEEMMAKIRNRSVSDSVSGFDSSPSADAPGDRSEDEADHLRSGTSGSNRSLASRQGDDDQQELNESTQWGSVPRQPPPTAAAADRSDLNRFLSAATTATATTATTTSFVKHKGPRAPGPSGKMRVIKPDDVAGLVANTQGKMRFDQTLMRWVRDAPAAGTSRGGLTRVSEAGETSERGSGSQESVDVFAGMESWGQDGGRVAAAQAARQEIDAHELSDSSEDSQNRSSMRVRDDSEAADLLRTDISDSDSDSDAGADSLVQERSSRELSLAPESRLAFPGSTPARPHPRHADSAPAVLTPAPAAGSGSRPIRSALRNANMGGATPGVKKRTGFSAEATPALRPGFRANSLPVSSGKRSVSFSDGKKYGKMRDLQSPTRPGEGRSLLFDKSMRTRRIDEALEDLAEMSLEDATPSKPSRNPEPIRHPVTASPERQQYDEADPDDTTIRAGDQQRGPAFTPYRPSRSSKPDATFLTECSFGVAHDRLVKIITDVQPFVPYWEDLTSVDLSNKGMDSVARLKEFLPSLEDIKLNDNQLTYLSGLPSGIRNLTAAGNRLSALSSFGKLLHLQTLDLSRNQLDSVTQLSCLSHLRELTIDSNKITDLKHIMNLEMLVELSVKGNRLGKLDMTSAKWPRMEKLCVANNDITAVSGLEKLEKLHTFDIERNDLIDLKTAQPMTSLRILKIGENDISRLDLGDFPKLRTLDADNNRLNNLARSGVSQSKLDSLSIRSQRVKQVDLPAAEMGRIKRLYISGNRLAPTLLQRGRMPQLQYLEAAACHITALPSGWSLNVPVLEILNLNYNYLEHVNGLEGMLSLRKVSIVGNRLGGGQELPLKGLRRLSNLQEVDLRMNPSTLGFYLPVMPLHEMDAPQPTKPYNPNKTAILLGRPNGTSASNASFSMWRHEDVDHADALSWEARDRQFRKNMPDEWYTKRLAYRGMVMRWCHSLRRLDGVEISDGEKKKASELLRRSGRIQ